MLTVDRIWGHTERPWGYEVRVDYRGGAQGAIINEVVTFPTQPTQAESDAAVEAKRHLIEDRLIAEEEARNIAEVMA